MGQSFAGASWAGRARIAALVLACLSLAQCSASPKFSDRVVGEDEPVPKGGGNYQVGKPYNVNGRTYVPNENSSYRAEGIASWYGPDFHGRLTANGEVFDMHAISAAHPTMPLPSYARVTNLDNKRSIIVRVNDRGPYARNRIVDLSIGTAKALGFYGHGLARVRVEYVGRAPLSGSDDQMLLATLREGSPAPAPSKVMLASAKPFLPSAPDGKSAPAPAQRAVSSGPPVRLSQQASANDPATPNRSLMRSRSASADPRMDVFAPDASAPAAPRYEASTLGLMSGRGLY